LATFGDRPFASIKVCKATPAIRNRTSSKGKMPHHGHPGRLQMNAQALPLRLTIPGYLDVMGIETVASIDGRRPHRARSSKVTGAGP